MSPAKPRIRSVLTGDVIRSQDISPDDHPRMSRALRSLGEQVLKAGFALESHEVIRGDSFQHIYLETDEIDRIALWIRAYMRSIEMEHSPSLDVRIGIGIGPVEFKKATQHESDGTAYRNAAAALEQATRHALANIWTLTEDHNLDNHLNAIHVAWEPIISRWTVAQAKSMKGSLEGHIHQDIAKKLKVTQPTVSRALQSADDKVIQYLLDYCQELLSEKKMF